VVEREAMSGLEREADVVAAIDRRLGAGRVARKALRYVFPDHWSFMLGEIALYAFLVLVATGVYLALFFSPDVSGTVVYHGPFDSLQGAEMTRAFRSTLDLSSTVPGGLLMRQTHHWAALVFVAAMVVHLLRVFFTAAYRRPRELTWLLGVGLLAVGVLEGFAGYSLPDDLLSGMGLAIAYSVALSIPLLGGSIGALVWGGQFPGPGVIESRLYILHVFILPAVMAAVIAAHLALVARHKHTQFAGPGRRSLGLLFAVAGVLVLLGGLVQVNPVWQWGPYELDRATNGAQPDWYLGWLIGGLRLMPPLEVQVFGRTLVPNPFWGGIAFPGVVFTMLAAWPFLEPRLLRDRARHDLLDRPRDHPWRTAFGVAFFSWVALIFVAGAADRLFYEFGISYTSQVHLFRALTLIAPPLVFVAAKITCDELRRTQVRPGRGGPWRRARRREDAGFDVLGDPP
jgi:ubiquinol-cytochrome c reductase cytochrome b subunit